MDGVSTERMMNDIIDALSVRPSATFRRRREHLLRQQLVLLIGLAKSEQMSQIAIDYARLAALVGLRIRA